MNVDWHNGPFFTATNYSGLSEMPAEVRRVAVLPLAGIDSLSSESALSLHNALQTALLAQGRFELVAVSPAFVRSVTGKNSVSSAEVLPQVLFERVAREFAADAVLIVDITLYRPYAPLALGVRAKLAFCGPPPEIFWAFDTLYDVREPAVANSARRHAAGGHHELIDAGPSALQSPGRFASYVFDDAFATLPPRPPPVPAPPATKVYPQRAD